jgi:hypothetical protein
MHKIPMGISHFAFNKMGQNHTITAMSEATLTNPYQLNG